MINKKIITITTIILNNLSVQPTLNKLVINFSTIQINYAQNNACTRLNSKMKCGIIHQEIAQACPHDTLRKTRQQVLRSPCRAHENSPSSPPMVINLSLKEVPNQVTCPQVQVFFLVKNYKYLLTKFIPLPCNMKYET